MALTPEERAAKRREAGQKAAATKTREKGYRLRVARERAREQAAKYRREAKAAVAQAIAAHAASLPAAQAEVRKALTAGTLAEGPQFYQEIKEGRVEAGTQKQQALIQRVQEAEYQLTVAQKPLRPEILAKALQEIRLGREKLEERIAYYYVKAKHQNKINPMSDSHDTGKTWRHESVARSGAVADRYVGKFLREDTIEDTVRRLLRAAKRVKKLQPDGKLYAAFSAVEYGQGAVRSPGPELYKDALGAFRQGFRGTENLSSAQDLAGFEVQIRRVLEEWLRDSGSQNAILIDSFEVTSNIHRSEGEQETFIKERKAKKRAEKKEGRKKS